MDELLKVADSKSILEKYFWGTYLLGTVSNDSYVWRKYVVSVLATSTLSNIAFFGFCTIIYSRSGATTKASYL